MFLSSRKPSRVVMVHVKWQEITMVVKLKTLECGHLKHDVGDALTLMK